MSGGGPALETEKGIGCGRWRVFSFVMFLYSVGASGIGGVIGREKRRKSVANGGQGA